MIEAGFASHRRLLVLCVTLAMALASACASGSGLAGDRVGGDEQEVVDALAWAGFTDITGLEVVDASSETGIDALERFLLRGSAEHVDRALEVAEFDAPHVSGMRVAQPPLEALEPAQLEDVVSGEDRWRNPEGQTLHRLYVRGKMPSGHHALHVWAFTT